VSPAVRRYVIVTVAVAAFIAVAVAVQIRRGQSKEVDIGPPKVTPMTSAAPPPPPAPPAGPDVLALLAPIVVGSTSKGWQVEEIRAVQGGTFRIVFAQEKDKGRVLLDVALNDEEGVVPPATAGRYAVYYAAKRALPEDGDRLAKLLARTIEKHLDAPTPAGLGKFKARPKEPDPL
jgi:hypothetical protein